jgi:hypothetical protein
VNAHSQIKQDKAARGQAMKASKCTIAKIRRWKEAAKVWPATAATGGFPYPAPTCAEVLPRHRPSRPQDFGREW